MKLKAQATPYSSTVGGGLMLTDERGAAAFIVAFMGTSRGITKEETEALTRQFKAFVDEHGLEVPDRVIALDSEGKERGP